MKVLLFKLNNISVSKIIVQVPLLDSESYGVFVVHKWAQDFTGVFCIEFNNFIDLNVLGKSVEDPGFLRWGAAPKLESGLKTYYSAIFIS